MYGMLFVKTEVPIFLDLAKAFQKFQLMLLNT